MNATAISGNRITDAGPSAPGGFAQDVANHYLRMISAYWRGNDTGMGLESWLARYRTPELPPKPARPDDAFSPHGGGGHGIHWIEANQTVFGYIDGWSSGYAIPFSSVIEENADGKHGALEETWITVHLDDPTPNRVPRVRVFHLDDQPTGHEVYQHVGLEEFDAAL